VTHARTREGVSPLPATFTREAWPWTLGRLRAGQSVRLSSLQELPQEAANDLVSFRAQATKAIVIVPVVVEGAVIGALGCSMQQDRREWPEKLEGRLRVLADTFAVVLLRRRAEKDVQRERDGLAHALRVATLGELAGSLAHEINQPLAAIASNAQAAGRLLRTDRGDSEVPEVLRDIAADAHRAAQVIRNLRALFRKEPGERHLVDMKALIEEVVAHLLRKDLERRDVRVELALLADSPRVLGDVVQLQQVTLNLLLNACEAMGGDGDRREVRIEMAAREAGILHIAIRDSGKGVAEADLESIFERFVTTKPDGLGMGLSISRSIVETHGGRIWATRNLERGLTMHIEFPCQEPYVRPGVEAKVQ
jgi:C4-dicarboxylate-specific signal transduction histidine kinase